MQSRVTATTDYGLTAITGQIGDWFIPPIVSHISGRVMVVQVFVPVF
jgi:hypothetical protein